MRGGVPGQYPKFSEHPEKIPHPVPLNLYDPFGIYQKLSPERASRGLISEVNNGRLVGI